MAFPDDAGLKGYSVVENPVSVLENTHRVIRHLLIQAEIDRFNHNLEFVSDDASVATSVSANKTLKVHNTPVNTKNKHIVMDKL